MTYKPEFKWWVVSFLNRSGRKLQMSIGTTSARRAESFFRRINPGCIFLAVENDDTSLATKRQRIMAKIRSNLENPEIVGKMTAAIGMANLQRSTFFICDHFGEPPLTEDEYRLILESEFERAGLIRDEDGVLMLKK